MRGSEPGLVGRGVELQALRERLNAARGGRGSVVLLAGEPGIGKSRLAREAEQLAHRRGFHVAWGRCRESEGAPPYWPWMQALRGMLAHVPARERPPETVEVEAVLSAEATAPSDGDRFRVFDAVARLLAALAERRPMLLVMDDLHRADAPSLRLLGFVAGGLAAFPVLLLGTYRDTDVELGHPLVDLIGEAASDATFTILQLQGLSLEDTAEFLRQTGGTDDGVVAVTLHQRTGGNPFFLQEIVRLGTSGPARVPTTVSAAVEARVRRLPGESQELLVRAAVLGRDVDIRLLAGVAGVPPSTVPAILEPAVAVRLITPHPEMSDRYRFVHVLIQEALYDGLGPGRREELHDQAVRVLDAMVGDDPANAGELAAHAGRAIGSPGGRERAYRHALRAARLARGRLADEEATAWYEVALDLAVPDDEERVGLLLELGRAAGNAGGIATARRAFTEAWDLASRHDWSERMADAALGLGSVIVSAGTVDAELVRLCQDTLHRLPPDRSDLSVRLRARLAVEQYWGRDLGTARALAADAVEKARRLGDETTLAGAVDALQFVLRGPDHLEERVQLGEELIGLASHLGDEQLELHARRLLIPDRLQIDLVAAEADIGALSALAERTRAPRARWYVLLYLALRASMAGHYEAALQLIDEAEALGRRIGAQPARIYACGQRFPVLRDLGRLDELEGELRELIAMYPVLITFRCDLAVLLAEAGRADEADALLSTLAADRARAVPVDSLWLASVALLAEAAAILDRPEHAAVLHDLLGPYSGRAVVQGVPVWFGAADRYLGLAASTLGRWEEAEAWFKGAIELHEAWGAVPMLAATLADYGALLRRRGASGDLDRAQSLAAEADRHAAHIGMARVAPGPHRVRKDPLTGREREILNLVASGHSNKEIARRLVVSVHTVERHVANIYIKIGARNRAEATAFALRHPGPRKTPEAATPPST
jgi:DNA-binding CsgD family transcriptional regulator